MGRRGAKTSLQAPAAVQGRYLADWGGYWLQVSRCFHGMRGEAVPWTTDPLHLPPRRWGELERCLPRGSYHDDVGWALRPTGARSPR
jgi:hypothetical protein